MATPISHENDIPPLPPLDVALSRLFDIAPTQEGLVHYRHNRHLLKGGELGRWGGVIQGALSNEFTVTNVFISGVLGTPKYDIVRDRYLENGSPELAIKFRQAIGYNEAENLEVWQICAWLRIAWLGALGAYESDDSALPTPTNGTRIGQLFLHPRLPTLPTEAVIQDLYGDRAWADLVLLTARHELGWYYLKVKAWHQEATKLTELSDASLGVCLTAEELERLSMRTQGFYYYSLSSIDSTDIEYPDQPPVERHDAPRQQFDATSDMSRLYFLLTQWYLKTYNHTVRAPRCTWPAGCSTLLLKYKGKGKHPQYCPFHAHMSTMQSKNDSRKKPPGTKRRYAKRQMRN